MQLLVNLEKILMYINYELRELQITNIKSQSKILPRRLIKLLKEAGYAKKKL